MASPLSLYTDLNRAVQNYYMSGPGDLQNDAAEFDFNVLKRMLGRDVSETVKSGPRLEDDLYLDSSSTAEEYLPNPTFSYQNPQMLTRANADWRFTHDHMMWTKHEFKLWQGSNRNQLLKEKMLVKKMRLVNSMLGKMKAQRFATPQTTTMEAQGGVSPYPLAAGVNEFVATTDNGLSTGYTTGTLQTQFHPGAFGDATEWTTFQGVSIASKANWRNKVVAYDSRQHGADKNNVFRAFREMWVRLGYKAPPVYSTYFSDETYNRMCIATTITGFLEYAQLVSTMGDNVKAQNAQDPAYVNPTFGGIPLEHWDGLQSATWYPAAANVTTTAVVTEGASGAFNKGPRYYFYNFNGIRLIFEQDSYWDEEEPRKANGDQPYTYVVDVDSWNQQWFDSRRHSGVVMPLAAAGFPTY